MSTGPSFQVGDGLLLVDPQNDFCPGGSLAVADGDAVIPVLNVWVSAAQRAGVPIFVSRDWHPPKTTHFKEYGEVWPPHCVMGTRGAEFPPDHRLTSPAAASPKLIGDTEPPSSAFSPATATT